MSNCLFTIVDAEHIAEGWVAVRSGLRYDSSCNLVVMVLTFNEVESTTHSESITILTLNDLDDLSMFCSYSGDYLRWGMKPVVMRHLLKQYDQVMYVDSDCYFVNDWSFLWDEVDPLLVTPHWRNPKDRFAYLHGVYNGGLVGASKNGLDGLQWWEELCLWNLDIDEANGFFVDQRYLDLLPVYWDANICKHRGVNAASWNDHRSDLVMVHFSQIGDADDLLLGIHEDYKREVLAEQGKFLCELPPRAFMIAEKTPTGVYGPVGGRLYSYKMAAALLDAHFDKSSFVVAPLEWLNFKGL